METTSSYPSAYEHYRPDMYTMAAKSSPEIQGQNAYGMTSALSMDSSMRSIPKEKKDNFLSSIFGALSNIVWEHLGKVPSSFMSNIHNTLSVTVVPNEGIISQDFFKNLTRSCEQLAIERQNDISENPKMMDKLSNKSMYDVTPSLSHIFTDKTTHVSFPTKMSLNTEMSTNKEIKTNENFNDTKSSDCPTNSTEIFNELDFSIASMDPRDTERPVCNDMQSKMMEESIRREITSSNLKDSLTNDLDEGRTKRKTISSSSTDLVFGKHLEEAEMMDQTCTNGFHAMWRKVVNGVSERFSSSGNVSPDSEVPTKKPNLSKPQRRKTCTIARVRGKGRGKSQLRRNGVSQSRHRKERTKQNIYCNIQDDLNAWKDSERYVGGMEDDESSINERTFDQRDSFDITDSAPPPSHHCSTLLDSLPFDVSSIARKRKQSLPNAIAKCIKCIPESSMEIDTHESPYNVEIECPSRTGEYRPRLISESSVDSEDSYCIVFENGSERSDYDYDDDSDETSDLGSDEDLDDDEKTTLTVRFNLEPQVHTMVKWDYAYRAARRGPWEEMARDRERFRGRIKCVERILNPILSVQHRNHVWHERFDIDEGSEQVVFITKTQ